MRFSRSASFQVDNALQQTAGTVGGQRPATKVELGMDLRVAGRPAASRAALCRPMPCHAVPSHLPLATTPHAATCVNGPRPKPDKTNKTFSQCGL